MILIFAGILVFSATASGFCSDDALHEIESLPEAWALAEAESPVLASLQLQEEAQRLDTYARDRERLPALTLQAEGDAGQRVSPGEERALGPSARGNTRALGEWILYDVGHQARRHADDLRLLEATAQTASRRHQERLRITGLLITLLTAQLEFQGYQAHQDAAAPILQAALRRAEAGVEPSGTTARVRRLQQSMDRDAQDARLRLQQARDALAVTTGLCLTVAPEALEEVLLHPITTDDAPPAAPPEARLFQTRADRLHAEARAVEQIDGFTASAFASAGLYVSRAYDRPVEPELFAGLSARWRPDLFGVRRAQAAPLTLRAAAAQEEARGVREEAAERLQQLRREARTLQEDLQEALDAASVQETEARRAQRRWEQGVGTWNDALEALTEHASLKSQAALLNDRYLFTLLAVAAASGALQDDE